MVLIISLKTLCTVATVLKYEIHFEPCLIVIINEMVLPKCSFYSAKSPFSGLLK